MSCYISLLGAPNCGKTALFNSLTGSNAKVANYVGVTVDKLEGTFIDDANIRIIDLPGTYSLRTTSLDEAVARDMVLGKIGKRPDALIAVADATNLRMTLRMVLEIKILGLPIIVALNLSDIARSRGLIIDTQKLSALLEVPVIETVAIKKEGTQALREAIKDLPHQKAAPLDTESAEKMLDQLDSQLLYQQVEQILSQSVTRELELPQWHQRLDNIVMHPVIGIGLLLVILLLVFQAVYSWAEPVMTLIEDSFAWLGEWVTATLPEGLLVDLLVNGVIAGVGGVLVFLPQITILFAFILLLEDSGYLPRAAFFIG